MYFHLEPKIEFNKTIINIGHVTDLINRIVQVLKRDLRQVRISTQDAKLMKPIKP